MPVMESDGFLLASLQAACWLRQPVVSHRLGLVTTGCAGRSSCRVKLWRRGEALRRSGELTEGENHMATVTSTNVTSTNQPDVVLIGAGIMSATLAVFLKELDPSLGIQIHEVLGSAAQESSNAWNNAGTGHAALCELNYTPEEPDGSIDISKALQVNTEFDLSRQFWAYLVKRGAMKDPQSFLHSVPQMSFVRGGENRTFLRKRFEALTAHPLYYGIEYTEDKKQIGVCIPLVMEGRDAGDIVTATLMAKGTVVD